MLFIGFLFVGFFVSSEDLPRQNIISTEWNEDFSERVFSSPAHKLKLDNFQRTSPSFENIFSRSSSIQSRNSGSPGVSIRGSAQAGRVLFLLDNIPLNLLDGFGGSPLFVPTEIISDVKMIEGPSSTAYGSNAMGGTLHFIPEKLNSPRLNLGVSDSDGSITSSPVTTAHVSAVVPVIKNDRHYVQVSGRGDHDRGDFRYERTNDEKRSRTNNSSKQNRWTLYGQHNFEDYKISEFLLYTHLNKATPGPEPSPFVTDESSDALLAATHFDKKISQWGRWNSRLSYARMQSEFLDSSRADALSDKIWTSHSFSVAILDSLMSQTFIEASRNTYKASFANNQLYDRNEFDLAQIFVYRLTSDLTIEPSFRHAFRYKRGTAYFLVKYDLSQDSHLWTSYAEGYRPPSLIDLYANTPYYQGNDELRAESSRQFEFGGAWENAPITAKSSVFFTNYRNLIQSSNVSPGVSTKVNSGEARASGIHSVLKSEWQRWAWTFDHSLLLTREVGRGREILFSPQHQFFTMLSYRQNSWQMHLQHTYWSEFEDNDFFSGTRINLSAWNGTDILWEYNWSAKMSTLLGIYNILDHRRELNFGYPEPQRRVALNLTIDF
ncbi:MAG: TonB-dependent receptor [Bdellovibrionales bacterium]|nr:TonB-dependent receptor [Bdellovibrionales bacterium]